MKTIATLAAFALALPCLAEIQTAETEYKLPDGTVAIGYFAGPPNEERTRSGPAVLIIPEWWGLTEYPKMRARELAEQGYDVFVADMYGGGKTTDDPEQAQEWSTAANKAGLAKLAEAALQVMKDDGGVDPDRIAAIGFCFGGSTVANMIKEKSEIAAGVSFHGGLGPGVAPGEAGDYAPLLVCHGGADPMVKPDAFAAFVQESIMAGVPLTVVNFPGTVHAFTNPDADAMAEANPSMKGAIAYDEQAAKLSMQIMEEFLEMTIGEPADDDDDDDEINDDEHGDHDGDHDHEEDDDDGNDM